MSTNKNIFYYSVAKTDKMLKCCSKQCKVKLISLHKNKMSDTVVHSSRNTQGVRNLTLKS